MLVSRLINIVSNEFYHPRKHSQWNPLGTKTILGDLLAKEHDDLINNLRYITHHQVDSAYEP